MRKWASDGLSHVPLSDWYDTPNGEAEGFMARPVVGGHLALVRMHVFALSINRINLYMYVAGRLKS